MLYVLIFNAHPYVTLTPTDHHVQKVLTYTKEKGKILNYNTENINTITLDGETLEGMETFVYLGNIIDEQIGFDAHVKGIIAKASAALLQSKNI